MRTAIVTNILAPYRVPLFNNLSCKLNNELKVFLCAATEPNRHWVWPNNIKFEYEIGSTFKWSITPTHIFYLNFGLIRRLIRFRPDVIVSGGIGSVSLMAYISSKLCGARLILWGEGIRGFDGLVGRMMWPIRKFLAKVADGFIASSTSAAEFFRYYGASDERIKISMITFDTEGFSRSLIKAKQSYSKVREENGLNSAVVLYVGQLESYKGVDLLLYTFQALLEKQIAAHLFIIGTGRESKRLQSLVNSVYKERIHFLGTMQPHELISYFAIADLFVLFSRSEPFGLVIAEAVTAGLPVMCSRYAGAAYDLVEDGGNGYLIDPNDISTNSILMAKILSDDALRKRLRERSIEIARKCDLQLAVNSMAEAVRVFSNSE
jgi:glycosyltransferase involved in cell wall biosynthesis